jgi:hypothetical protein
MIMATPEEHFDAARQWQERYDDKLRQVGMRAPEPVLGQTVSDYRRDVLIKAKKAFIPRTHQLRQFSLDDIKGDALNIIEQKILDAAVVEAQNPANVPPGELRKIERLDGYGKVKTVDWIGQQSFVRQMGTPGRRMSIFNERTREWYPPRR